MKSIGGTRMRVWFASLASFRSRGFTAALPVLFLSLFSTAAFAQPEAGREANLELPRLSSVSFAKGIDGHQLPMTGTLLCLFWLGFGPWIYSPLKKPAGHRAR